MGHNFENLDVWKRSIELAVRIHGLTKQWRDYHLRDQVLRSSLSIPSNIAEGSERGSDKEFAYFLNVAKGSAAEFRTQAVVAGRLGLLSNDACASVCSELVEISRMLQGLVGSLSRRKRQGGKARSG